MAHDSCFITLSLSLCFLFTLSSHSPPYAFIFLLVTLSHSDFCCLLVSLYFRSFCGFVCWFFFWGGALQKFLTYFVKTVQKPMPEYIKWAIDESNNLS